VIETWTAEVHEGQHLAGDVLTLMNDLGFELFDVGVAAAWHRRVVDTVPLEGKPQVTGLDLLFFRTPTSLGRDKRAKLAAIATIYGFPDFGLQVSKATDLAPLAQAITASCTPVPPSLRSRARRAAGRLRGPGGRYPSLHT
jgi:hypothetical protein